MSSRPLVASGNALALLFLSAQKPGVYEREQAGETQRSDCMENCGRGRPTERLRVSTRGHIVRKIILINGNGRRETQTVQRRDGWGSTTMSLVSLVCLYALTQHCTHYNCRTNMFTAWTFKHKYAVQASHVSSPLSVFYVKCVCVCVFPCTISICLRTEGFLICVFSLMLLLQSDGDCAPLPSPFICTRGPGLINDWARACTERRAASRQAGSRAGRLVLFSATLCMSLCGWNRGHFPAEETLVYVSARETVQKSWLKNDEGKQKWRCVYTSVEPRCYPVQNSPESQRCVLASPQTVCQLTCYCNLYDLIKAKQAEFAGSGDGALPALLSLMGPAWPCQEGCVCRWMQMAS